MNFDELILEAAKSIAAATAALIKAASEAQRELVHQGKVSKTSNINSEDGQWSEGLVSAARLVAAATHNLCEAANALVKGHTSEEKLIGAAKQVAGSTAQLLLACKVKADPESQSMKRLENASHAVRKATDNLVKAAQQAIDEQGDDPDSVALNTSAVNNVVEVSDNDKKYIICSPFPFPTKNDYFFFVKSKQLFTCRKSMLDPKFCEWKRSLKWPEANSKNYTKGNIIRILKPNSQGK